MYQLPDAGPKLGRRGGDCEGVYTRVALHAAAAGGVHRAQFSSSGIPDVLTRNPGLKLFPCLGKCLQRLITHANKRLCCESDVPRFWSIQLKNFDRMHDTARCLGYPSDSG